MIRIWREEYMIKNKSLGSKQFQVILARTGFPHDRERFDNSVIIRPHPQIIVQQAGRLPHPEKPC